MAVEASDSGQMVTPPGSRHRNRGDQLSPAGAPTMTPAADPERASSDGTYAEGPVLTVGLRCSDSQLVLSVTGMLARHSVAALEAQIDQIGCAEPSAVVLDLTYVAGIDATGVNVVLGLVHYVRALGRRVTIIGARGQVAQALADADLVETPVGGAVGRAAVLVLPRGHEDG
jgi:anti-anti-sigma factor